MLTPAQHRLFRQWLVALLVSALAVALSFRYLDVAVARAVAGHAQHLASIGNHMSSALLLSFEAALALGLAGLRLARGRVSPLGRAVALGCVSSISAYAVNASVLKVVFGVVPPMQMLDGAPHLAVLFAGSEESAFPSGHMVLAAAFAGVLMRIYPRTILPLSGLLLLAAVLLVTGDWHFVSDVVAGGFLGLTAGILAAEIWQAHEPQAGM